MEKIVGEIVNLLGSLNEYATLILVFITALYSFFLYRSFKLSQKDYEVRNRPYLAIVKDQSWDLKNGKIKYLFGIKNSGKTPAQLLSQEIRSLKCEDPGEKFSNPSHVKTLKQKAILPMGQATVFDVDVSLGEKKIGLEIIITYRSLVFRKIFKTKVLFKLEGRSVYPIDSFVS
jgi:hypothetical protein